MLLLFGIILCLTFLWICVKFFRRNQPPNHPGGVIKNSLMLGFPNRTLWSKVEQLAEECTKCGGITRLIAGPDVYYVITDPEVTVGVLNCCLEKGIFYRFWKPWLGDGAVTASVPIWKAHRKQLNPMFHQRVLDDYQVVFNRQARRMVDTFRDKVGAGPVDPFYHLTVVNLETVCLTTFGVTESPEVLREYCEAIQEINRNTRYRFERFWLHNHLAYSLTWLKKRDDELLRIVHGLSNKHIQKRKLVLKNKQIENTEKTQETHKLLVDMLFELEEENLYTAKQVREEVDTFLFGGHDSVSTTMMYALICLGSFPKVQEKVYDEIQKVLGDKDYVSKEDLTKLVYLDAVFKESMRLYPFAPFVSRIVDEDVKLKNCTLSAGSTLFILSYGTHRHPMWGPDADQFRPERWLDGTAPTHQAAFAGFSWGKRGCIGKPYAIMTVKTTLVYLIRNYVFEADHTKLKFELDVTLKPLCGQHISIMKR